VTTAGPNWLSTQQQKKDSELRAISRLFSLSEEENLPALFRRGQCADAALLGPSPSTPQHGRPWQHWVQRRKTPVGMARRAHAMLLLEQGHSSALTATWVGLAAYHVRKWAKRFQEGGAAGLREKPRSGRPPMFAPEVAPHLVKLACERPDHVGSSLSQWDCPELARRLKADGVVSTISADTIERILRSHKLKPWRHHLWLSADVPRDQHFAQQISDLVDLYTRPLADEEMVVCADEKTNLQPRPRLAATLPTRGIPTDSPGAWLQADRSLALVCRS